MTLRLGLSRNQCINLGMKSIYFCQQISTWFANARRRLKKDNKMTWSPRNKSMEKKDGSSKCSNLDRDENANSTCSNDDEEMSEIAEHHKGIIHFIVSFFHFIIFVLQSIDFHPNDSLICSFMMQDCVI